MTTYNVFKRTWWKPNSNWTNGLEPHLGRKNYIAQGVGEKEAIQICREYNAPKHLKALHGKNRLSIKAEFEDA
jgi:hypothetical protein